MSCTARLNRAKAKSHGQVAVFMPQCVRIAESSASMLRYATRFVPQWVRCTMRVATKNPKFEQQHKTSALASMAAPQQIQLDGAGPRSTVRRRPPQTFPRGRREKSAKTEEEGNFRCKPGDCHVRTTPRKPGRTSRRWRNARQENACASSTRKKRQHQAGKRKTAPGCRGTMRLMCPV